MIVCKLELWPGGDKTRARSLGSASIVNVGGDAAHGDYELRIAKSPNLGASTPGIWKEAYLLRFPRRSKAFGPWDLLAALLIRALGERLQRLADVLEPE